MKADAVPLLAVFEKKMRLEVPLFQRPYVWNQEKHWEPLWEDIERKFSDYIEGNKQTPVHFLGAVVLDQKQTPTTHVERRQVIDGQQRLTTLQIFLSAFRDFCRAQECEELAKECDSYTFNRGMMADPDIDKFKVWPTHQDRPQFTDAVASGSRDEVERRHPLVRKKYKRNYEPRPRMIDAYLLFYTKIDAFFLGDDEDPPLAAEAPLAVRLEECFQALKNALQIVTIDLEQGDDAQIIFETLNARGEPLLPADLLRNYIFLRAGRNNEPVEKLYDEHWKPFDHEFWRKEVKQGRLLRPRSDLFIQHYLASRQGRAIAIRHLFVEYKHWVEHDHRFNTVADELDELSRQGRDFRRLTKPKKDDCLYPLATFLEAFDIRTTYPLMLAILDKGLDEEAILHVAKTLQSYLLRRAVCGRTTKNYNRLFLGLARDVRQKDTTAEGLRTHLLGLKGDSVDWPTNSDFAEAWNTSHVYHILNNPKIVYILRHLSETYFGSKMEEIPIETPLTVEHIMPQKWTENWPLADGREGAVSSESLLGESGVALGDDENERIELSRKRNAAVQTFGNLTILTQALNAAVSNGSWQTPRPAILKHSLLPINQQLAGQDSWDESAIEARSKALLERAIAMWPRP